MFHLNKRYNQCQLYIFHMNQNLYVRHESTGSYSESVTLSARPQIKL